MRSPVNVHSAQRQPRRRAWPLLLSVAVAALGLLPLHAAAAPAGCASQASDACYFAFAPAAAQGRLHYYASLPPGDSAATPTNVLIVVHGHPRDANIAFNAALRAVRDGGAASSTLVVAPVFQVSDDSGCHTDGVPAAQPGDLVWRCASWIDGGAASNGNLTAFAALDALLAELQARWPSLGGATLAGFSAGAQLVQHYIGFAQPPPGTALRLRYVVADPGSWLYFDAARAAGNGAIDAGACPALNRWKYGTDALPAWLPHGAAAARAEYASADITYLEGARDQGHGRGAYAGILDKSCAANAQGADRLQRGLAYAAYDREMLAPARQRQVRVIPGCAHDATCVYTSTAGRAALLGQPLR